MLPTKQPNGVISIRAPLAGSDVDVLQAIACHCLISIRAPLAGSDVGFAGVYHIILVFQSALPLRGATGIGGVLVFERAISIRAPLAGSD